MCLWRNPLSNKRPASSSPTTPTGSTLTPRSARLLIAFAPPPGETLRSRCLRIKTGASRETRDISPKTNSSATRSPTTVIVTLGNDSTIFRSRSDSLGCLVIKQRRFSHGWSLSFCDHAQHGIHCVICVCQFHLHRHNRHGL